MARRSKTNKKRTRMKKSKKGGENTSEKKRATKTMQKYRRGTLGRRKASSRRMAQGINKGLDTLNLFKSSALNSASYKVLIFFLCSNSLSNFFIEISNCI